MKRANTNKATHKGSCQACGAIQKLPSGTLSLHGYNVKWGFFSGICPGSGFQSYEKGTDQIQKSIVVAQGRIADLEALKVSLLAEPTEGKGWINLYVVDKFNGAGRRVWTEVEFSFEKLDVFGDRVCLIPNYFHPEKNRTVRFEELAFRSECPQTVTGLAAYANRTRVERQIEPAIRELKSYIAWQQKRVADWKEKDLLPL